MNYLAVILAGLIVVGGTVFAENSNADEKILGPFPFVACVPITANNINMPTNSINDLITDGSRNRIENAGRAREIQITVSAPELFINSNGRGIMCVSVNYM